MMRTILRASACQESVWQVNDTCDIYFTYTKVNHLLYMCSLDPFEDGILLDTPLVCSIGIVGTSRMMRRSASAKEHLHPPRGKPGREDGRRRNCRVFSDRTTGSHWTSDPLQPPDDRRTSDV